MSVEVTDEMVQLALDTFLATPTETIGQIDDGMRQALAAVLAIVERDYRVIDLCGDELVPGIRCHLFGGHQEHEATTATGNAVRWT